MFLGFFLVCLVEMGLEWSNRISILWIGIGLGSSLESVLEDWKFGGVFLEDRSGCVSSIFAR